MKKFSIYSKENLTGAEWCVEHAGKMAGVPSLSTSPKYNNQRKSKMNDYTYVAVLDYNACSVNVYRLDGNLSLEEVKEELSDNHNEDECYYMLSSEPFEIYINNNRH